MRPQRNKQFDWSKPFKLIQNRKQFQQIDTGQDLVISIPQKQSQSQSQSYKKQNIITPKIQTLPRVTSIKPFAKIAPNYIRLAKKLNLPKLIDYQLTEVDHMFIKTHSQKFKIKGKVILTQQFLIKVFIELELKAGKDPVIPRNKGWMMAYLERQYKELINWENLQNFAQLLYNFWKNRREDVKFPLLRPLWRPNPDEFNHLLAFKPREKQKRNLRKTTRISQDEILTELHEEFQIAKQITERIQFRQELRFKQLQTQLTIFHNQCKVLFGMPDFFGDVSLESRTKDKQRIKMFHQKLDKLKIKREQPYEPEIPQPVHQPIIQQSQQVYNQKLSMASFLATVVCEAEAFGINFSSIFESKLEPIQFLQSVPSIQKQEQSTKQQPFINLNLFRSHDLIIRDLQSYSSQESSSLQEQDITYKNLGPKRCHEDVIDFYKNQVTAHYIGEDDEFDGKDLRRNIAMSFKKFQSQLKQM